MKKHLERFTIGLVATACGLGALNWLGILLRRFAIPDWEGPPFVLTLMLVVAFGGTGMALYLVYSVGEFILDRLK